MRSLSAGWAGLRPSPIRPADVPLNLLVDSTGIMFLGDSEWHTGKRGSSRRRQQRRVHLANAAEIHIRVALINRFNALGTADVVRVA